MLHRRVFQRWAAVLAFCLSGCVNAEGPDACEMDNESLRAMSPIEVTISEHEQQISFAALKAATLATRQAGFQSVCAERVDQTPMLFVFESAVVPNFHMSNVVTPLDIAFIDERGRVESIQTMQVYEEGGRKPYYRPSRPIRAALEARAGFFKSKNLTVRAHVTWKDADAPATETDALEPQSAVQHTD